MKSGWWSALICLLVACTALPGEQLPSSPPIQDAGDLLRALQEAGAEPALTQGDLQASLGGSGSVWRVDRAEVQVYEYPSEADREAVSERLGPDGRLEGGALAWPGQPNIWGTGRLIVAYVGTDGGVILLLSGLLGDPLTASGSALDEPYPPAVLAAMQALAQELGRAPAEMQVVTYQEAEWPDGCLGLAAEGENCTQAVTPGWLVIVAVDQVEYEMRTDELGLLVRRR
jgi:hypothetical protein